MGKKLFGVRDAVSAGCQSDHFGRSAYCALFFQSCHERCPRTLRPENGSAAELHALPSAVALSSHFPMSINLSTYYPLLLQLYISNSLLIDLGIFLSATTVLHNVYYTTHYGCLNRYIRSTDLCRLFSLCI